MVKNIFKMSFVLFIFLCFQVQAQDKKIDLSLLKDLNNQNLKIDSKDTKVFLYFWAYWCPDCETKFTNFFPENLQKIKIPIITINTDSKENKTRGFIEKHKILLPVVIDKDKSLRKVCAVNGVPSWAILTRQPDGMYLVTDSKVGFDESEVKKILGIN